MAYAGEGPVSKELTVTDGIVYFGDKDTNGSWRIFNDSGTLKIQVRILTVWTDKDTVEQ